MESITLVLRPEVFELTFPVAVDNRSRWALEVSICSFYFHLPFTSPRPGPWLCPAAPRTRTFKASRFLWGPVLEKL